MKHALFIVMICLGGVLTAPAADDVIVVYNSLMPGSKDVADHYAAMRQVPKDRIFSFALTTNEIITRADFKELLQKPLADKLEAAGLWKFEQKKIPAAAGQPAHVETRVTESKVRYAALCYGIPLKIAPASIIEELAQKMTREEFRRNEAAVDSELAWLPFSRNEVPLTGPLLNPAYSTTNRATLNCTNGILLVARLDGPTPEIARSLVDKAMAAESNGFWGRAYFDARGLAKSSPYYEGDLWMMGAAQICRAKGFDVEIDTNAENWRVASPMSHIAFYAGWYADMVTGPFLEKNVEFMPGAFAYHLYSFSAETIRTSDLGWCGPLLARGAACTMGCVYEPYLQFSPNIGVFTEDFLNGWTFGESACASQNTFSWQNTIIGDPLYCPFAKPPQALHDQLERKHDPLIEWSYNRLINLDLVYGLRASQLSALLENTPATTNSAVLTEKLGQLYDLQGKPSSAIEACQRALTLNPSPHQRIRLHLLLSEKLLAAGRLSEAAQNWRQFIADSPTYPDLPLIRQQLKQLEKKIPALKK